MVATMGKWDDDYVNSDAYLGYGPETTHETPTELPGDVYAAGKSMQKQAEKLLPPELHKYAHLAVAGVRERVGWLSNDQKRDALSIAAAMLYKAVQGRKAGFSEAQFCGYIKKSIAGELLRQYANEIAYRSGQSTAPPGTGIIDDWAGAEYKPKRIEPSQKLLAANKRDDKSKQRKDQFRLGAGLLSTRLREIMRRRADGETLQAIGTNLGVSPQRVRELEQRAEVVLDQKLARLRQGEKLHMLVREAVVQDPANSNFSPYEIDNLVRSLVNPGSKPRRAKFASQQDENADDNNYEYDPDDLRDVRTEEDYASGALDTYEEDFRDEETDDYDTRYEEHHFSDAELLEDL